MAEFVLIVDFRIKPERLDEFKLLISENARMSCRDEPGCCRFDVLEPPGEAGRIVLYEIYNSRAAFDFHLASAHYARFAMESKSLVLSRQITELGLIVEGTAKPRKRSDQ